MLVSVSDGFVVDLGAILSTAEPSKLRSRLGAVQMFAILGMWFCLASWMLYIYIYIYVMYILYMCVYIYIYGCRPLVSVSI